MIADLGGGVVGRWRTAGLGADAPPAVVQRIADEVRGLLQGIGTPQDRVLGLGVVAPGPLTPAAGMVLTPPVMQRWTLFPLAASLAGFLVSRARAVRPRMLPLVVFGATMAGSLVFTHPIGIAVMGARLGMSAQEAITTGAVFLPGDVIKNVLVAVVAAAVFRAFPDMLERR